MDDPADPTESTDESEADDAETVTFDMDITDSQTVIRVTGDRDTSVIVESASGEMIYLPPEDFDRPPESGRQTAYDSPYQSRSGADDSPYQAHPDASLETGLQPTADGYRIVHPEPVMDLRFIR